MQKTEPNAMVLFEIRALVIDSVEILTGFDH